MTSPFFEGLFFGEFVEKSKNEIVLEGIKTNGFLEYLFDGIEALRERNHPEVA